MKKFLDFHFYKVNYIAIFILIISILWVKLFNISEIYENTIYENIAVIPLLISIFLCLKIKNHKIFFRVLAMLILLITLREFNYGRVPFCAMPDNPHEFYSWSHYKYGWVAHIIIGIYMIIGILYGLFNKICIDIIDIIKKTAFPFWSFSGAFICVIIQYLSERKLHNTVLEEIAEFIIYCLVFAITYIYYQKLKK